MNIYQRINEVRKAVDFVRKDKRVGEGGYLAVTHDAVTALTREHFVKHGVVIIPMLTSQRTELTGTHTARGVPFIRFEASYRFEVVNAEDPADKFTVEIAAHAIDQGDKAPGKALSYAKKYCVLKLLEIESGEEEEEREQQHKAKESKITPSSGVRERVEPERRKQIEDTAILIKDALNEDRDIDAYGYCENFTDPDEKVYLWTFLDSKERRRIKAQAEVSNKLSA